MDRVRADDEYRALILKDLPAVTTLWKTVDISDKEVLQDTFQRGDIADLIGALSAQPGVNFEISRGIIISP